MTRARLFGTAWVWRILLGWAALDAEGFVMERFGALDVCHRPREPGIRVDRDVDR